MSTENEMDRTRARNLAESLREKVKELTEELMERNINAIASELLGAADASGGFALRFGLAIVGDKVAVDVGISWSRKFSDKEESSFPLADPQRPELPGIEEDGQRVTIRTEDGEISTTLGAMKRAGKRLAKASGNETED